MERKQYVKRIRLDKEIYITKSPTQTKTSILSDKTEIFTTDYLLASINRNRIRGFAFSIPLSGEEGRLLENVHKPFWYPVSHSKSINNNTNPPNVLNINSIIKTKTINAFIVETTETHYILNNNMKIEKNCLDTSKLKGLKRNTNISQNEYEKIIQGNELKENILYPFTYSLEGNLQIYNVKGIGLGSRIVGKVQNNYLKTLEGKFKCIFLRNHANKSVVEAECYKISNNELFFKEVFLTPEGTEIKGTFKIDRKIAENRFLCVSKNLRGIFTTKLQGAYKEGDIIKCIIETTELGVFLSPANKEEDKSVSMAIDFCNPIGGTDTDNKNENILQEKSEEEDRPTNKLDKIINEAEHLILNERLIYLTDLIKSSGLNEKNTVSVCIFYIKNIKSELPHESLKKPVNKIVTLLQNCEKISLIKEFLKSIYRNSLFEESLINIFLKFNIKKPILLFYFSNKRINNMIEILEKEPQLISHLYESYYLNISEIRSLIELLIKKSSNDTSLLFNLLKTYVFNETKLDNFLYSKTLYERMFQIKFKKTQAKQLCENYLQFCDKINSPAEEANKKCEDYVLKYLNTK
ncbi:hypothetical protein CDIK_0670 [Cucumispora dikerogammari]|nr:hypothetical protein CDIK_0670 [Cucumispora dikerogammari]